MESKSLEEFVAKYEKKTGDKFEVPDGFQLAFDEAHGFFVFGFGNWQGKTRLEICATAKLLLIGGLDKWQ